MASAVRALKATADLLATKSAANPAVAKASQIITARRAHLRHARTTAHHAHTPARRAHTMAHHVQTAAAMDPAITIAVHTTARRRATIAIQPTAAIKSPMTDIAPSVRAMRVRKVKAHVQRASASKAHARTVHVRTRRVRAPLVRIGQITKVASHISASQLAKVKLVTVIKADTAAAVISPAAMLPVPVAVPTRGRTGMVRSHLSS